MFHSVVALQAVRDFPGDDHAGDGGLHQTSRDARAVADGEEVVHGGFEFLTYSKI